jgi:hypothetical protein
MPTLLLLTAEYRTGRKVRRTGNSTTALEISAGQNTFGGRAKKTGGEDPVKEYLGEIPGYKSLVASHRQSDMKMG